MTLQIVLAALAAMSAGPVFSAAAPGVIGIAMSDGPILLDNARTAGNATIFDGSILETESAMAQVEIKGGARVRFAANSRGRLFSDHVDLEKGSARIRVFAAKANGLTVRAEGVATLSLQDENVEVAALEGNVRVFSASGVNVANLPPGRILSLRTQDAGANPLSVMTGCVTKSEGGFRLNDDLTGLTVQLDGAKVRAGHIFRVTGSLVADPRSPIPTLHITNVSEVAGSCGTGTSAPVAGTLGTGLASAAKIDPVPAEIRTRIVASAPTANGATGTAVAVIATGISPSTKGAGAAEKNCAMRRGSTCNSPSPTGSSNQTDQLSNGK